MASNADVALRGPNRSNYYRDHFLKIFFPSNVNTFIYTAVIFIVWYLIKLSRYKRFIFYESEKVMPFETEVFENANGFV